MQGPEKFADGQHGRTSGSYSAPPSPEVPAQPQVNAIVDNALETCDLSGLAGSIVGDPGEKRNLEKLHKLPHYAGSDVREQLHNTATGLHPQVAPA